MEIRPLSPQVGAEVVGVDISQPLPEDVFKTIDDAYNHYSVLVFRRQELTPEQQIAFSRLFGELEVSARTQFSLPGHPEILVLSNIIIDGKPIGNADAGRTWHTDMSYTKTPPRGSLLYAREIPIDNGRALGDTIFASAAAAYDTLSPEMKKKLTGLRAIHRARAKKYAPGSKLADAVKDMPDVEHPVIRTHAVTGRNVLGPPSDVGNCALNVPTRLSTRLPVSGLVSAWPTSAKAPTKLARAAGGSLAQVMPSRQPGSECCVSRRRRRPRSVHSAKKDRVPQCRRGTSGLS